VRGSSASDAVGSSPYRKDFECFRCGSTNLKRGVGKPALKQAAASRGHEVCERTAGFGADVGFRIVQRVLHSLDRALRAREAEELNDQKSHSRSLVQRDATRERRGTLTERVPVGRDEIGNSLFAVEQDGIEGLIHLMRIFVSQADEEVGELRAHVEVSDGGAWMEGRRGGRQVGGTRIGRQRRDRQAVGPSDVFEHSTSDLTVSSG